MAQAAIDAFGGIDILINNAAIMTDLPPYGLGNMPAADWDRVMDVNLRGPLLCTQAVLASMVARGGGRIVNGLSAGAFMAGGIYSVSKYALHGLTVNLASELGHRGIYVNAIAPGLVENESGFKSLAKDSPLREALAAGIPGKTSGPPDDLVGALLLLCSPAGEWINGQTIQVDGGWLPRL
jgi:NAD(P)-dependent dehydrogenase (short-subunit alcohol dehydrogenase family)